jgi:hypothetical protein
MKKITGIAVLAVLMMCFAVASYAQDTEKTGNPMMGKGMAMDKPMQGCMMQRCPMMGMKNAAIVTIGEGNVIVLMGNKLLKYDKNLELKKEVEIQGGIDTIQMKGLCPKCQAMMQNKGQCPMCGQMMQGATAEPAGTDESNAAGTTVQ